MKISLYKVTSVMVFSVLLLFFITAGFLIWDKSKKNSSQNVVENETLKISEVAGELSKLPKTEDKPIVAPPLTIDSVFGEDHEWVKSLPEEKTITMIATGDIIPARYVNYQVVRDNNFHWPYGKTADYLRSADLTFANLEASLIPGCPVTSSGMVFCGDERNVWGLQFAGVDVANLANNHAGNYGEKGVLATRDLLNKNGIEATGIDGPLYKEVKSVKFAFLGYNDVTSPQPGVSAVRAEVMQKEIGEARAKADIVIVALHAGAEYRSQPDFRQIDLAHMIIDDGADVVIGNHPHWIQPPEIYKGKFIMYAHGNFIFDQMWSENTRKGVVGKYTFYDKKLVDVEFSPVLIENYAQPNFMSDADKKILLDDLKKESLILASPK